MQCLMCGGNHGDQERNFPKGATVVVRNELAASHSGDVQDGTIKNGMFGTVVSHTIDKRMVVKFDGGEVTHVFHCPDECFSLLRKKETEYCLEFNDGDGVWRYHSSDDDFEVVKRTMYLMSTIEYCPARSMEWRIMKVTTVSEAVEIDTTLS